MGSSNGTPHIVIIGAGIGGLTAAIVCRRANPRLQITILERNPEILAIGAGIHIPPNACRVFEQFGLLEKLKEAGGYQVEEFTLRRYANGQTLATKPLRMLVEQDFGAQWLAIHRGDYQKVLLKAAVDLGATVMTHAEAKNVETSVDSQTIVTLGDGKQLQADAVVGADGLWSGTRDMVLGHHLSPEETGDLAYRATFSRKQLLALGDEDVNKLLDETSLHVWLGPGKHAVFYPLRGNTEYNLVLLVADDLPIGVATASGTTQEMASHFDGWDPILRNIISCSPSAPLKWKLLHLKELKQWTRGTVALLGDASHPSLPYLGQGAAMAVEDGATLGLLLATISPGDEPTTTTQRWRNEQVTQTMRFYEALRKDRAEVVVAGSVHTRHYYHLDDGAEQRRRDEELGGLAAAGWRGQCSFNWGDAPYQMELLSFDVVAEVERALLTAGETNSVPFLPRRRVPIVREIFASLKVLVQTKPVLV